MNKWINRCDINWESKTPRNIIIKDIESLLREKFSWDKIKMCETLWQFIGIDINEFRQYGIEPCNWLSDLEELSDLRRVYWLGIKIAT
ncbi:MAG: hypothetical protein AT718_08780 [Vulcanisaeta sp. JCHS_4]|jgi:hypothetical protein|nr:MAG: hypothetical protein AT718_08780 [Vulcanisaeta sp. JCHS_4]